MKLTAALCAVALATAGSLTFGLATAHAVNAVSEEQYWNRFATLFDEFLGMKQDGVFMDHALIQAKISTGVPISNRIRGESPPGGYYFRPPGSGWLKRVQTFRSMESEGGFAAHQCTPIPKLYTDKIEICGFEILQLYMLHDRPRELDSIISQFHLALLCRQVPKLCEPDALRESQ